MLQRTVSIHFVINNVYMADNYFADYTGGEYPHFNISCVSLNQKIRLIYIVRNVNIDHSFEFNLEKLKILMRHFPMRTKRSSLKKLLCSSYYKITYFITKIYRKHS